MKKERIAVVPRFNKILDSNRPILNRICIGVPLTGVVRAEWMMARYGQVIPCNWSAAEVIQWVDTYSPMRYSVADARNLTVKAAVENEYEWLLFIDHDVILPPDTFLRMNEYMYGKLPVVAGLYHVKGEPADPLVYRGKGNGSFRDWKPGEKVWVDTVPMGCTLLHGKLLKAMYDASEFYVVGTQRIRRVFDTPREVHFDPVNGTYVAKMGTEDFEWCERVIKEGWLKKLNYTEVMNKKYPFLIDTAIKCGHIDMTGRIF